MSEIHETELRERVRRAYAGQEREQRAPSFQAMWNRAQTTRRRPAAAEPVAGLAVAGAAALVIFLFWPDPVSDELDDFTLILTTNVSWQSPTDVLLELGPDEEPLTALPEIQFPEPAVDWPESEERS